MSETDEKIEAFTESSESYQLESLLNDNSVLHLTLKGQPFEVMLTGEKNIEVRKPSEWIESRLIGKRYDYVKFVNGYGSKRPLFVAEYMSWFRSGIQRTLKYSNGLNVSVDIGDCVIRLGDVIYKDNIEMLNPTPNSKPRSRNE